MMTRAFCMVLLLTIAGLSTAQNPQPQFEISSADFRGEIWGEPQQRARILFQDGALPWPVPGGMVWAFGDTFLGERDAEGKPHYDGSVSATVAFLPDGSQGFPPPLKYWTGEGGAANSPFSYLPEEDSEVRRIWPAGGAWVNGKLYAYYGQIEMTGEGGPFGFKGVGAGLASGAEPLGPYERLMVEGDWRWPIEPADIVLHNGWVWLLEPIREGHPEGMIVARVRPEGIADWRNYEYWTGQGESFAPQPEQAAIVARDVWAQVSVEWNEYLDRWLLITSSNFYDHRAIWFRTAEELWGPWSEPVRLQVPEREGKKTLLIYCTYQHPELSGADGRRLLLTFCRMLEGDWEFTNPELVEVELTRADAVAANSTDQKVQPDE